jgi:solute:Na+ symporter, SSS family
MYIADALGFGLYLAVVVVASRRRAAGATQFVIAGRTVTLFPLVATLVMTEFNPSTLLAFSAAGYSAGPMALSLPLVFLIGLAFYTATVARQWKRFDRLSVAEFFAARYSPALGRVVSSLLLAAMAGFCATYVKSMALLFVPFAPAVPPPWLGAALTAITLAIVLPGGLLSVVRADVIAFLTTIVMLPGLFALGLWRSTAQGGLASGFAPDQLVVSPLAQWTHPALPFWFVSTLIVLTCATYIAAPWYGQKIFAARNERTAVAAMAWSAALVFVLYGAAVMAAAAYRAVAGDALADPQLVLPRLVHDWLPGGVRGVALAVLFAAAITTLGGVWTAMGIMIAVDFGWTAGLAIRAQRVLLTLLALVSWLLGTYLVDDILDRLILANVPVAALAFALLAGFHWPRATPAGAWASLVVGVVWGAGCFAVLGDAGGYTWPWAMYGIPLIFITGIVVSLCSPGRRRPIVSAADAAAGAKGSASR